MEMIMKRALAKKNGKKGFTLVEVIVVLVILAILAAIAIPALTGYIDKANTRALITEGRTIAVALQATASDYYGTNGSLPATSDGIGTWYIATASTTAPGTGIPTDKWGDSVNALTSTTYTVTDITKITFTGNKLTKFTYKKGDKYVNYLDGKYTVGTSAQA
jgi:type IV pilus assembly protein PilA